MKLKFVVGDIALTAEDQETLAALIQQRFPEQKFLGSLFVNGVFAGKIASRRKREAVKHS